jgi:hypothetical protein
MMVPMGLPAIAPMPFETALRDKVQELFSGDACLEAGRTFEGEPLLEIRTVLGVEDADRRLRGLEDWMSEQYPYDTTVVGLLHVRRL